MRVELYCSSLKQQWDNFANHSKNGTFIHLRDYMDYHSHRFTDSSLFIYNDKEELIALLPANREESVIYSHAGLTYGGLITHKNMTAPIVIEVFDAILSFFKQLEIKKFIYKTIPAIYHSFPAEEDLYALFLCEAKLIRRDLLSVINNQEKIDFQERRQRMIKKAKKSNCVVQSTVDYTAFWDLLTSTLQQRYGVAPVHSLSEIQLLAAIFPQNIKLFNCYQDEEILAGIVVYETATNAHAQYIASSEEGKKWGALDLIFDTLINEIYPQKRYFDFGISNEKNGKKINVGLVGQKEGFGARGVIHDCYEIDLMGLEAGSLRNALQ